MPVIAEDVTVTESDVTESMRRDNLRRVDKFLQSASEEEAKKIRGWAEHRLMALGAIQPEQKIRKRDRVYSRLAVESVPILLTLVVIIPLISIGVLWLMYGPFLVYTRGCPPMCSQETLFLWALVLAVGFMFTILGYYTIRKVMIRARK